MTPEDQEEVQLDNASYVAITRELQAGIEAYSVPQFVFETSLKLTEHRLFNMEGAPEDEIDLRRTSYLAAHTLASEISSSVLRLNRRGAYDVSTGFIYVRTRNFPHFGPRHNNWCFGVVIQRDDTRAESDSDSFQILGSVFAFRQPFPVFGMLRNPKLEASLPGIATPSVGSCALWVKSTTKAKWSRWLLTARHIVEANMVNVDIDVSSPTSIVHSHVVCHSACTIDAAVVDAGALLSLPDLRSRS